MQRCHGCMKEYGKEFDVCPHCGYIVGSLPENKSHLPGGTVLSGRYMLGKVLGYGGFGITYIAWDSKLSRAVAIKEFFPNPFSTRSEGKAEVSCYDQKAVGFFREGIRKMLDEGIRLSRFSDNDNIVDVYDCFEENNTAYIVMEYLEGKDLKQYLVENGGKLAPEKAVEIILPVLNALEDMHKEKLIHRDISPDNIYLCENGKIKLLDFGSARLAVEDSDKSLSVMVKRGYAPKEQYASRSKQGPWTDIYAVCATLYKLITGTLPSESIERDSEPLVPFKSFGIKDCEKLEKVVFKGLEVEYTNRIRTVSELRNGLIKATETKQTTAKDLPQKLKNTKKKKVKINPKVIISAVVTVVVVAGIAFAIKFVPRKNLDKSVITTSSAQQSVVQTSKEIDEGKASKAAEAYKEKLETYSGIYSAYVVDLNKDGVQEVICVPDEPGMQFMMTYTAKGDLSIVDLIGHSSMMPELYISEDNCIYMRDDGHNQGTAFYHHAAVYKVDETGFVKIGEVEGDKPEDFDWEDEAVFNEMDKKYEKLFEDKLNELIGKKHFITYSEVANTQNPVKYLNTALSLNMYFKDQTRGKYVDFLNSLVAEEYYQTREDENKYDMYYLNQYDGDRQLAFYDLDFDGIEECVLIVSFPSDSSLSYEVAHIFDIEGNDVRCIYSTEDCGSHRAQNKFAIIEDNGKCLIHYYVIDPHWLCGSVYSYDGEKFNLVWSYEAEVTNGIPEEQHKFIESQEYDLFEGWQERPDYMKDYYNNRELPEYISGISREEFYEKYNGYRDAEVYRVPMHRTSFRVTNSAGAIVRSDAGADYEKVGNLHAGDVIIGHYYFTEEDSNGNEWIRIELEDGYGWVAMANLAEEV